MTTRIGVDVGGTFTDLVFYDEETASVRIAKGPSISQERDRNVLAVVRDAVPRDRLERTGFFVHGTTAALNALLERKCARVGLLTTAGFRDVLELRRGDRARMNDYRWVPPAPLVPRDLRLEARERIRADGTIDTALALEDVDAALEAFRAAEVEAIAVVYVNGYANPEHELATAQRLRAGGFEGEIVLSHAVSGEFKEYERTSTAVIDAAVRPIVVEYLRRLEAGLRELGIPGHMLITNSGGGAMSFAEAEQRSFLTINSGPVAGAVAAAELCAQLGHAKGIAADVGGTSFDTCLLVGGKPTITYGTEVADMPLQAPFVDVHSIGAGGGSLAYRDAGGLLRVGPQSAGAMPGPACYGRGGTQPTVTDAAAVLGMLATGELAGGLRLDLDAARAAVGALADEMGMELLDTARGIVTIASAAMANAVRAISLERGHDPRECALVAFGGAGPLFATLIADELSCAPVLVPVFAGNFSAWGLLDQDRVYAASQTVVAAVDEAGMALLRDTARELRERLASLGGDGDGDGGEAAIEVAIDARYAGQEYTVTIPFPETDDPAVLRAAFDAAYEQAFGHALDDPLECVALRVTQRHPLPPRAAAAHAAGHGAAPGTMEAYSFRSGRVREFATVVRETLEVGTRVPGPAIVTEQTSTTYVDDGSTAEIHPNGTMVITDDRP